MGLIVREPIREYFVLMRIVGPQHRKQTGVEVGEGIEVLAVNVLDPLAILLGLLTVANADQQRRHSQALKRHSPRGRTVVAVRPGM
jgi:hypothetical protein